MCLVFMPNIANPIFMGRLSIQGSSMITWMNLLMFVVLMLFAWIQMKGYTVFGVSDFYFREALLASAGSLGYSIEETMSCLRIKETGHELQVAVQGWIGTAQLKSKTKDSENTTKQLADGMTKYFQSTPGNMNYMTSCF